MRIRTTEKQTLTPSPENESNPDKLERKKKKSSSGKGGTLKGALIPNPRAIDRMAQDISEELIWDFQEKDAQDCQSWSKKTQKDSDREAKKVAREKEKEEEEWKRKKKRKGKRKLKNERKKRSRKQRNGLKRSN